MKVLCVENIYREMDLTVNVEYEVLHESNTMYRIKSDKDEVIYSSKWRFSKDYLK